MKTSSPSWKAVSPRTFPLHQHAVDVSRSKTAMGRKLDWNTRRIPTIQHGRAKNQRLAAQGRYSGISTGGITVNGRYLEVVFLTIN